MKQAASQLAFDWAPCLVVSATIGLRCTSKALSRGQALAYRMSASHSGSLMAVCCPLLRVCSGWACKAWSGMRKLRGRLTRVRCSRKRTLQRRGIDWQIPKTGVVLQDPKQLVTRGRGESTVPHFWGDCGGVEVDIKESYPSATLQARDLGPITLHRSSFERVLKLFSHRSFLTPPSPPQ